MSVIDNLSDTEITHLLNTIDKVGAMEDKLSDYSEQLKNITSDLKDTFLDKTNTLKIRFTSKKLLKKGVFLKWINRPIQKFGC